MRLTKTGMVALSALVMVSMAAAGCAKRAASSSEAIEHARTLKAPEEQANYLISQAQAFLGSKNYQEAVATAQYVLANVDANSKAARGVLQQAKAQLEQGAKAAAGDMKKKLGF